MPAAGLANVGSEGRVNAPAGSARPRRNGIDHNCLQCANTPLECRKTGAISNDEGQPVYYEPTDITDAFRLDGHLFRKRDIFHVRPS
jgi:hypothetical protein